MDIAKESFLKRAEVDLAIKTFLCIEVFPVTCWVEWVEPTLAVEAEVLFNIGFACHSIMFPQSPRRTCNYHVTVHVPEYQCQLDFQVWHLLLSLQIGQIKIHQVIYRCTSNCPPNHRPLGFKQHKKVNLPSLTVSASFLRWASEYSFACQQTGTYGVQRSCPWHLRLLYCPWGYHGSGSCYSVHESLHKAPEAGCLLGKEGCPGKGQHGCKDCWVIRSFFTPLLQQLLGFE